MLEYLCNIGNRPLSEDPYWENTILYLNGRMLDETGKQILVPQGEVKLNGITRKESLASYQYSSPGGRLTLQDSEDFNLGLGDFTLEGWFYPTEPSIFFHHLFGKGSSNLPGTYAMGIYNNTWHFHHQSNNIAVTNGLYTPNTWTHFAACRSSGALRLYLNGNLRNTLSYPHHFDSAESFNIGDRRIGDPAKNYPFIGYQEQVRVTKGIARYAQDFSPGIDVFLS